MKKNGVVVGRVPRELSKIFWRFLSNGGQITSVVTGGRKRGKGLEVPCTYKIEGKVELVQEFKRSSRRRQFMGREREIQSCPY